MLVFLFITEKLCLNQLLDGGTTLVYPYVKRWKRYNKRWKTHYRHLTAIHLYYFHILFIFLSNFQFHPIYCTFLDCSFIKKQYRMERLRSNSKTMEIFLLEYCFTEKINVKHLTNKNKTFSFRTTRFWAKSGYLFLYYYTWVFVQLLDK